jgi:pimeloyl-ACP methyl ester carboxylesterase
LGLAVIGPTYLGEIRPESLDYWDGLAAALEANGVDGFVAYIGERQGIDSPWRDSVLRFTRERMLRQEHPEALAQALREVPRSRPFDSLGELRSLDVPALVVASNDDADPGHPYAAAAAYAEALPRAELISEAEGDAIFVSTWQDPAGKSAEAAKPFLESPLWQTLKGRKVDVDDARWMSPVSIQGAHLILDDLSDTFGVDKHSG